MTVQPDWQAWARLLTRAELAQCLSYLADGKDGMSSAVLREAAKRVERGP